MENSQEIREKFLKFFENKGHKRLNSFSLVPQNDPSLLWVSAGMSPFKFEFEGTVIPSNCRITTCQKCLRADDIELVGKTDRHHTFFEMLGNFSFGDYFKKEAVEWAWELLTQIYNIPKNKLLISVHPDDEETYSIWLDNIKIPKEKIYKLESNWWGPIAKTGTCGPDTEIYFDRGHDFGCKDINCKPDCQNFRAENIKCDRYIEIWNLVFTMYNKDQNGNYLKLLRKNIDTGAGLERLTAVLQNKENPYETDLFFPFYDLIKINNNYRSKVAKKIIADHLRACVFAMSDNVFPSNKKNGYVLKKILRRAFINLKFYSLEKIDIKNYVSIIIEIYKNIYPNLENNKSIIIKTIEENYIEYEQLINQVSVEMLKEISKLYLKPDEKKDKTVISGKLLFKYHDEKGLPYEISKVLLESKGFEVNEEEFNKEMEQQKIRSYNKKGKK